MFSARLRSHSAPRLRGLSLLSVAAVAVSLAGLAVSFAAGAAAAEERALSGAEIAALLPTVISTGERSRQTFETTGGTMYVEDRPSHGRWRVDGDRYCSQWPPSEHWSCYDVLMDDVPAHGGTARLIWITSTGQREVTGIQPR